VVRVDIDNDGRWNQFCTSKPSGPEMELAMRGTVQTDLSVRVSIRGIHRPYPPAAKIHWPNGRDLMGPNEKGFQCN
jgi:hypothetical protein